MTKEARVKLWMFLGTAFVLAVAALLGVMATRDDAPEPTPQAPEGVVRLKIVDQGGDPVPQASLFVQMPEDAPRDKLARWISEEAVLEVPASITPVDIAVQARGFRSEVVTNLAEDRTFVLRMGYMIKLKRAAGTAKAPKPYRLVFQLNPVREDGTSLPEDQYEAFLQLIDTRTQAPDPDLTLPRSGFGFAIWDSVAADGILLPFPGRYAVRWGLLDPTRRPSIWFSLGEAATAMIRVSADDRTQVFEVPLPQEAMDRTQVQLEAQLRKLDND